MTNIPFISFITPIFNEELNIQSFLANLRKVLEPNMHWNWEVILIEDGSKDNTRNILLKEVESLPNVKVILHNQNKGYTASLKDGLKAAQGKFLMYIGADEEFDSSELPAFVEPLLKDECDVVLGVRWQRNAYKLFRFFLSVIYIFLLNYLFKLRINDYNWSQAWRKDLIDKIDLKSKSLFVLPEIIIKANDMKYRIKEVPSNHRGRRWGKSSVNMKIMGFALWEAIKFYLTRNSKTYRANLNKTTDAIHQSCNL